MAAIKTQGLDESPRKKPLIGYQRHRPRLQTKMLQCLVADFLFFGCFLRGAESLQSGGLKKGTAKTSIAMVYE